MIAKVIGYAPDRAATIDKVRDALGRIDLGAFVCNRLFLQDLIDHVAFRDGRLPTNFVAEHKLI